MSSEETRPAYAVVSDHHDEVFVRGVFMSFEMAQATIDDLVKEEPRLAEANLRIEILTAPPKTTTQKEVIESLRKDVRVWRRRALLAEERNAELLEALEWYVENDEAAEGMPENQFWVEGRNRARELIAKAKGGAE